MKRLFRLFVVLGFCLLSSGVMAQVTMSDIWRWGLVRKSDMLPPGASITYPTNGVLRVITTRDVVDHTRFSMTVVSNLVTSPEIYTLSNGVYVSSAVQPWNGGSQCVFIIGSDAWPFMCSPDATGFSDGPKTYQFLTGPDESTGFGSTNSWNSFPGVIYGNYPTNAPPAGMATIDYYRYVEVVTNDFVSQTLLQDTIDDLRLEISEAIEAHVQLLH